MKKLKLEELAVDSFEIQTPATERGTVAGHDLTELETCFGQQTCGAKYTCANSCACEPYTASWC